MPGNPLPPVPINLEQRNPPWPFEAGAGWGAIPVTAAPKAVFDASQGPLQTNGYLVMRTQDADTTFPLQDMGGEQAASITFSARSRLGGDGGAQKVKMTLAVPQFHFFEYIRLYQPENYYHRCVFELESTDTSITDLWQPGDVVTNSSGGQTTVHTVGGQPTASTNPIWINANSPTSFSWEGGTTVTNQRTGTSIIVNDAWLSGANNKFNAWWVDDGDNNNGYANGALNFELDSTRDGTGNSSMKVTGEGTKYAQSYPDPALAGTTIENQSGTLTNQLSGGVGKPIILDTQYNGSYKSLVIERKRSDSLDNPNGEFRAWMKTEGVDTRFPQWELIYERVGIGSGMYDINTTVGNNFSHGDWFGPTNSGYDEDTVLGISDYQIWLQKPTFLSDAGV